jgi:hypothetical protein
VVPDGCLVPLSRCRGGEALTMCHVLLSLSETRYATRA